MNKARNNTPNGMNGGIGNRNGMNNGADNPGGINNGMNGRNPNGANGRNPNGGALTGNLLEQIRALCFVKTELELYLDTHPRCRTALDYYYRTVAELKRLTEEYENTVGPLTGAGNINTEHWDWVDGPWPWQQAGDFKRREGER